jgi:CheY-like chemotaxis protein
VLVVEDDAPSARLVDAVLTNEGATVKVVRTAEEALAAVPVFPARLMIVDLILPRMSGLLLVESMKADPSAHDIIAIAVSAVNGPEAERAALRSGCAAYLRKPIDIDTLIDLVISLVQGRS